MLLGGGLRSPSAFLVIYLIIAFSSVIELSCSEILSAFGDVFFTG